MHHHLLVPGSWYAPWSTLKTHPSPPPKSHHPNNSLLTAIAQRLNGTAAQLYFRYMHGWVDDLRFSICVVVVEPKYPSTVRLPRTGKGVTALLGSVRVRRDVPRGCAQHWRYAICTPCLPAVGVVLFFFWEAFMWPRIGSGLRERESIPALWLVGVAQRGL